MARCHRSLQKRAYETFFYPEHGSLAKTKLGVLQVGKQVFERSSGEILEFEQVHSLEFFEIPDGSTLGYFWTFASSPALWSLVFFFVACRWTTLAFFALGIFNYKRTITIRSTNKVSLLN